MKEAMEVKPLVMPGSLFQKRGAGDKKALSPVSVCLWNKKTSDSGRTEEVSRWLAHREKAGYIVREKVVKCLKRMN